MRVVQENGILEKNIRLFFKDPPFKTSLQTHTSVDSWKGQVEKRFVTVSSDPELLVYLSWPGLTHVWEMKKTVTKNGEKAFSDHIAALENMIRGVK